MFVSIIEDQLKIIMIGKFQDGQQLMFFHSSDDPRKMLLVVHLNFMEKKDFG
jgi:hypothetical protein